MPSAPRPTAPVVLAVVIAALMAVVVAYAVVTRGGDDTDPPSATGPEEDPDGDNATTDGGDDEDEDAEPEEDDRDELEGRDEAHDGNGEDAETPTDAPDLNVELVLTEVATMNAPTAGAVGPDGALYLAERAGTLHRLGDEGVGPAIVDLTDETSTEVEQGLLGVAFSDEELYLSSTDAAGDTLLSAFALVDGEVDPDDRRTVFTLEQPAANHNGGHLAIGPDGSLYLGLGDGGGAGDPRGAGQDLSSLLGSLLRIDPGGDDPYAVPADNPYVNDPDAADEIFAYGLRNPWRFSFDSETDEFWLADVGQDTREEVNVLPFDQLPGANLGWNRMEGTVPFAGDEPGDHVAPVYEYGTHGEQGCAITGGFVYRGEAIPALTSAYLYSDSCNGAVRALIVEDDEVLEQADLGIDGGSVVSFVEDEAGELYVLDLNGPVRRIDPG